LQIPLLVVLDATPSTSPIIILSWRLDSEKACGGPMHTVHDVASLVYADGPRTRKDASEDREPRRLLGGSIYRGYGPQRQGAGRVGGEDDRRRPCKKKFEHPKVEGDPVSRFCFVPPFISIKPPKDLRQTQARSKSHWYCVRRLSDCDELPSRRSNHRSRIGIFPAS